MTNRRNPLPPGVLARDARRRRTQEAEPQKARRGRPWPRLMGATHFLTKTLPKAAAEMALSVLAYNLTGVVNIVGIKPLIAAIVA